MRPRYGGGGGGPRRGGPQRGGPPSRGGFGGGRPRREGPPDSPETALSKVLSYALRHQPEEFGLNADQFGFIPLNELLVALQERPKWVDLTEDTVTALVEGSEKQRFEIRDGLIRARYGHSYDILPPSGPGEPPEFLYHGTPRNAINVIMEDGLKSMRRKYVHLSSSQDSAREVGQRRDDAPVILAIRAKEAHDNSVQFFPATELIYLCENVPAKYIDRPEAD